jgi:hypothetical protein
VVDVWRVLLGAVSVGKLLVRGLLVGGDKALWNSARVRLHVGSVVLGLVHWVNRIEYTALRLYHGCLVVVNDMARFAAAHSRLCYRVYIARFVHFICEPQPLRLFKI